MAFRQLRSLVQGLSNESAQNQKHRRRNLARRRLAERLEDRRMLAGPELLAVRPDSGALLRSGDTLNVAPRDLNLLFQGGANLDQSSISTSTIRLFRTGGDDVFGNGNDVEVALGYVGLVTPGDTDPANLQRIVMRPASSAAFNANDPRNSLPDDTYRIDIVGSGPSFLRNLSGEAFDSSAYTPLEFRLDRGAQVVSVVPQPVSRNTQQITISATGGTYRIQFNGETTEPIPFSAGNGTILNALRALPNIKPGDVTVAGSREVTFSGQYAGEQVPLLSIDNSNLTGGVGAVARSNILTQASNQVVVYFDDQQLNLSEVTDPKFYRLIDTAGTLTNNDDRVLLPATITYDNNTNKAVLFFASDIPEGNYRLDIGKSGGVDDSLSNALVVGSLSDATSFVSNQFLGDSAGVSDNALDIDMFRVNLNFGATLNVLVTPQTPALSLQVRLIDRDGAPVPGASVTTPAGIAFALNVNIPATNFYFIEVTSANGETGAYQINASVAGSPVSTSDNNSSFATATPLGSLGAATVRVAGAITPQLIPLPPLPGGEDDPGHREIQRESHINSRGTTPTLPQPTQVVRYYFPSSLGVDPAGGSYQNFITETEKQIVRDIFEIYAAKSGYAFIEAQGVGSLMIGKGNLQALDPTIGPNDGVAGLGGPSGVVINGALYNQADRSFGDGFTGVMFHEIGHALGLGHSYDQPSVQGAGVSDEVLPGDVDIIHLQRIVPPNSTDIDMYSFTLDRSGQFTAETIAERLANPSQLNSVLSLYRRTTTNDYELVARNDDYYGADAFLHLTLTAGTYFIGISSVGNTKYDPRVPDSGFGGSTNGNYELQLRFVADRDDSLRDKDGTAIDGDADGTPGGVYSFWFQSSTPASTIYVDKAAVDATKTGALASPYDTISAGFAAASNRIIVPLTATYTSLRGQTFVIDDGTKDPVTFTFNGGVNAINLLEGDSPATIASRMQNAILAARTNGLLASTVNLTRTGRILTFSGVDSLNIAGSATLQTAPNLVRIVGNGGGDQNINTQADNRPYLIGLSTNGTALPDGAEFLVPQGVTVMIQAGALLKMRKSNLDVGTSAVDVNRSAGALQLLGTPRNSVFLRSYHDDTMGGNSDGVGPQPASGDFGGIVFRDDSDLERSGVFYNYVNHADIKHGGGKVFVGSSEIAFSSIYLTNARPTLSYNYITAGFTSAISASPNSFEDSLDRLGPDIHGNFLQNNAIDGLFIRVDTPLGSSIDKLSVSGRFNDTDISHVLQENLIITGAGGGLVELVDGTRQARPAGRLVIDAGVVLKLSKARIEAERGAGSIIAEGTTDRPVVFTSLADDRFGGSGSFNTDRNAASNPQPGDWGGLFFGEMTSGSFDHALVTYGGGVTPIEGGAAAFNAIEMHQARVRVANSLLQSNASGQAAGTRNGRGGNANTTIYVSGSQPVIVNNVITDNLGSVVSINANALNYFSVPDYGRSTGVVDTFSQFADNHGPLVRLNRLENNGTNGMVVRGSVLTTESIWDDTDIVHVLLDLITVSNLHTYGGLTLQSSNSESLVVKLAGANAGFTATGNPVEIIDRVGGTIHVLGTVGHPVILTALNDDSVGAGFTPSGSVNSNTDNSAAPTVGTPGTWRGFVFDEFSNDRNVAAVRELENPLNSKNDVNNTPSLSQLLGTLAPDEKSGDENRRLGFQVKGYISPDSPEDVDVYSFVGTAGTRVWIDIDRTDPTLDAIVEVTNQLGTVLARSVRSSHPQFPGNVNAADLIQNPLKGGDYYTQNFRDPGLSYTLPTSGTFYVRVRSNPASLPVANVSTLAGESRGQYQLQIRLRQVDEFPGSTVQYADIRFAQTGIDLRGLPAHSPLVAEAGEIATADNNTYDNSQVLVNLLQTDMAAIGLSGALSDSNDVDWYSFDLLQTGVQVIGGVNDSAGTIAVVLDIDFADQVSADTTIAVYDSQQRLIYVSRESNVQDDQPANATDRIKDLSRGSLGNKDPFIGPIHLIPGQRYYVAVMSDRLLPSALTGAFYATPAGGAANGLVRLEPVNSLNRVVEDHIGLQGFRSSGSPIVPLTPAGLFDISTAASLANHITPFSFSNVQLYVATDLAGADNDDSLYTVDPFNAARLTQVSSNNSLVGGQDDIQDIVIRSDGRMFGYQRQNGATGRVGALVELNPENGAIIPNSTQADNIGDQAPTPNTSVYNTNLGSHLQRAEQFTTSNEVDAFTFQRRGTTGPLTAPVPVYDTYYSVRESATSSKLYRGRQNGDAAPANNPGETRYGLMGNLQPAGVTYASTTIDVSDNAQVPASTRIRIESKLPGSAGNAINVLVVRQNDANANVLDVAGNTITLNIGGTGGPPLTDAPSAADIVDAINNHEAASALVTAVIVGGNANNNGDGANGTVALNLSNPFGFGVGGFLTGGSLDSTVAPLRGRVTGLSFGNFNGNGNLYGVTNAGEFLVIDPNSGTVIQRVDTANALGIAGLNFQGLALGPQNVEGGKFANTLFAVTSDARLVAFDLTGNGVLAFNTATNNTTPGNGVTAGVPDSFISDPIAGLVASPVGLAFSPLDFNLWHPTTRRGNDAGHGINPSADLSRVPGVETVVVTTPGGTRMFSEANGGISFQFGFEQYLANPNPGSESYLPYLTGSGQNTQYGILATDYHADLSSNPNIANSYNMPGGASGSLTTNPFSLASSTAADRPTLYFNYFLETENHQGSSEDSDDSDPFRDSARVFASTDGGLTWNLVATNNSQLSSALTGAVNAELPGFLSHLSDAGLNSANPRPRTQQIVQELMDSTGQWRQARIDLSDYAGQTLMLRVDFATAGAMEDSSLGATDANFGETRSGDRSIRSVRNRFEGFYIDDIIVGYAERGEMVTGAVADPGITNLFAAGVRSRDNDPAQFPDPTSGPYQLEVRRTGEYQLLGDTGIVISSQFNTNDRHIDDVQQTALLTFEAGTVVPPLVPVTTTLGGVVFDVANIQSWSVNGNSPFTGSRALQSAAISNAQPVAIFQASANALGSVSGNAGVIRFAYKVNDAGTGDGFRFFINGVPQPLATRNDENPVVDPFLVTGTTDYRIAEFSFGGGSALLNGADILFTWMFDGQTSFSGGDAIVDQIQLVQQVGTGLLADRNRERPQGVFIIDSNFITNSSVRGINVEPGTTQGNGSVPHPGVNINFPQQNADRLIPGAVIQNNVIAGSAGIRFAGDAVTSPQRPVSFGRIVNNTLVGRDGNGIGIDVSGQASPTLLNNVLTGLGTGIINNGVNTVIRSNFFQANGANGAAGTAFVNAGNSGSPFVNAAAGNYYLAPGSGAVDSSQNVEQDRFNYVTFKNEIGIPESPIHAPDRDVYGQLRVDSNATPGGGGAAVFKDRGAVDRSDTEQPFASLLNPVDNDALGLDRDPNSTVVHLTNPLLENFTILLGDGRGPNSPFEGTGVNGATVFSATNPSVSASAVTVEHNGQLLTQGVDYNVGYSPLTGVLLLTPFSSLWEQTGVYTITLNNAQIEDLAGNKLRSNQTDDSTKFFILMPDVRFDFGDAPVSYGTVLANNPARHTIQPGATPRLGIRIDSEDEGQASPASDDTAQPVVVTSLSPLFTVAPISTGRQISVQTGVVPVGGERLTVAMGTRVASFELVKPGFAPQTGFMPVLLATNASGAVTDDANAIATKLANAIRAELVVEGNADLVEIDAALTNAINVSTFDDEDGAGIGTFTRAGITYGVFLQPGSAASTTDPTAVLGFLNPLDPLGANISVTANGAGMLDAWIDFDGNGTFDNTEQIFKNTAVVNGVNTLRIITPAGTSSKSTWARFRISDSGDLEPTGIAIGGEVEDYQVQIINVPLPTPQNDSFSVNEDEVLDTTTALSNPSLMDNDVIPAANFLPIQFFVGQQPANGTVTVLDPTSGRFIYTPRSDFYGVDTFTYRLASQSNVTSGTPTQVTYATVTITVNPVNDTPSALAHSFVTKEDTALTITARELIGTGPQRAAGDANPLYPVGAPASPFDESYQVLNIVSLQSATTTITAANAASGPFAIARGTIMPTFDATTGYLINVVYTPSANVNADTSRSAAGARLFDTFVFTVEDDGVLRTPAGVELPAPRTKLRSSNTASILVTPQNDAPTLTGDNVSVGLVGVTTSPSAWRTYFTNLSQTVPVPTEDQVLNIPSAFLLRNDIAGNSTSTDENSFAFGNDGAMRLVTVTPITTGLAVTLDGSGNVVLTPPDDVYGDVIFTYEAEDQGVNEEVDGVRTTTPRRTTATVTVTLQPVNDQPVAFPRSIAFTESGSAGTGPAFTFNAARLINGANGESTSLPGLFDTGLGVPFNEAEQSLRVVAFRTSRGTVDVSTLVTGTGTLTLESGAGGRFEFDFQNGAFTNGRFISLPDYNQRVPFAPQELLEYLIADDGRTTRPQGSGVVVIPSERSASYGTITISVAQTNDAPVFTFPPVVNVLERDEPNAITSVANFITNITPGPTTALDELNTQSVRFVVDTTLPGTNVPQGLMRQAPTIDASGTLQVFPVPDAVGTAVYVFEAIDSDANDPSFVERRTRATVTIALRPVNDAPRVNPSIAGTSQSRNADEAWSVATDGTITFTMKEDNTGPLGATSPYSISVARDKNAVGYQRLGLLDVFNAGPANEGNSTQGGSQVLRLSSFQATTSLGGTIRAVAFDADGNVSRLEYTPPLDYNISQGGVDSFSYVVEDNNPTDGETYDLSTNLLVEDRRTATGLAQFRLLPVNDKPLFEVPAAQVSVLEDAGPIAFEGFVTNLFAGRPGSAFDEIDLANGQRVSFSVTAVSNIAGLFTAPPTISSDGILRFTTAPDAFGTAVFELRATDNGPDNAVRGDLVSSDSQRITINIRPVNDRPVLNTTTPLTFSLNEDAMILQPGGQVINRGALIPLRGAAGQAGLLDVFNVGPTTGPTSESANVTPGGNQRLSLTVPIPASTVNGGTLTQERDSSGNLIGLRYTPRENFNGIDSFVYGVVDNGQSVDINGNASNDPQEAFTTVTLQVAARNDAPIFGGAVSVTVDEDASTTSVLGEAAVPNWATNIQAGPAGADDENNPVTGQRVTFTVNPVVGNPAGLFAAQPTVSADGTLTFRTVRNATGVAVFTVVASDSGNSNPPLDFNSSVIRTFTITVRPVNDAPSFTPGGNVVVDEDSGPYRSSVPWATNIVPGPTDEVAAGQTVTFQVTVPDSGKRLFTEDGLPMIEVVNATDSNGNNVTSGFLRFNVAPNASGSVQVTVVAVDSVGTSATPVTFTILVNEVNDVPGANNDTFSGDENTAFAITPAQLLANDRDADTQFNSNEVLSIVGLPSSSLNGAAIRVLGDGRFEYNPIVSPALQALAPGQTRADTFTYRVQDVAGRQSNLATVTVNVAGRNDPPVLLPDAPTLSPTGVTTIRPLLNDSDIDGTIVPTSLMITLQPSFGSLERQADGTLIYTPFSGFRGSDVIRYTVADNLGLRSDEQTITIDVNQAPVAVNDRSGSFRDRSIDINVASNDSDTDGTLDLESVVITRAPARGTALSIGGGLVRYVPEAGFIGTESFQYTIRDARGRESNVATVTLEVVGSTLQNPVSITDVNSSGQTSPLDALLVINRIARARRDGVTGPIVVLPTDQGPNYFDVDGNGVITPNDALRVINQIARDNSTRPTGGGEGELAATSTPQFAAASSSAVGGNQRVAANDLAVADFATKASLVADFSVPLNNAVSTLVGTYDAEQKKTVVKHEAAVDAAWADAGIL